MSLIPAARLAGKPLLQLSLGCPHCNHAHHTAEAVRMCGLFKAGWRLLDADGYACSGPYTRPDGDGLPKQPVRLVKSSCRTCEYGKLRLDGALACTHAAAGFSLERQSPIPILDALEGCTAARKQWRSRAPRPPIDLLQLELLDGSF